MRSIINEKNLENKKILLRLDLNVPLEKGKILDTTRIDKILPTLNFLIKEKAKIIILTHVGRPNGKITKDLSLKPICEELQKKLGQNVKLIIKNVKEIKNKNFFENYNEEILVLENIRFYSEEEENDSSFAKHLSRLGDLYINEAFSCSHRKQASLHKITKYIDSYGGPLLEKEIQSINLILKNKKEPVTSIIGGSKVSTKINVLLNLIQNVNNLIIVGAMANNFLKFKGFNVGLSLLEKGTEKIIEDIYTAAEKNNCNIIIPVDCIVSNNFNGSPKHKSINEVSSEDMVLDIGKKTVDLINKTVENSKTVFWNGPAGYFENKNFSNGTIAIAKKIGENTQSKSLISIVGGGDTLAAIKNTDYQKLFTHLSTAGGAFLESLEGKQLPGVKVLTN